jgi:hypothetical protein
MGRRQSENFEDRRGMSSGGKIVWRWNYWIVSIIEYGGEKCPNAYPILEQFNQGQVLLLNKET